MTVATENTAIASHVSGLEFVHKLLAPLTAGELGPEHVTHQIGEFKAHILWQVGHCLWFLDQVLAPALGGESCCPAASREKFGNGTKPTADPSDYPAYEEMA